VDGERIRQGRIYVAPPDRHLIIEPGVVRVTRGPRENRFRPAIDPLFRSAAQVYGPRVIGVILTGGLDDGVAGLWAVKQLGGTAIVQDPDEALFDSMPRNALQFVRADYRLPIVEVAPRLVELTRQASKEGAYKVPEHVEIEVKIAKEDPSLKAGVMKLGDPSIYTCPECHGVLLQMKEENRIRFRCHAGHAFSIDSLIAAVNDGVEESLWSAVRSLEEKILLMRHLAEHVRGSGNGANAEQFLKVAREAEGQANLVRRAVTRDKERVPVQGDTKAP